MLVEKYLFFQGNYIFNILELPFKKNKSAFILQFANFTFNTLNFNAWSMIQSLPKEVFKVWNEIENDDEDKEADEKEEADRGKQQQSKT